ncbi:MAG: PorV/PorQ family protein [Calditrichales bacterium]|nr:PorV/PorQ family protein [Calditrichales bacterium]
MRKIILIFILISLPFLVTGQSNNNVSKTGSAAAVFLEIPVGAAAVGMGGAFVSIANDATALYWNAAGIADLPKSQVLGVHSEWIAETNFDYAALTLPLAGYGTIGLSLVSLSMDDMKVRTIEKPDGTGEFFSASDIMAGLSYAWKLTDRFAIGFTGKYIQQKIWHMSASAFAVDIGTTFRTDLLNGMVIGASIYNFGTSMKLSGRDARRFYRIDDTKAGSNERIPHSIEMDSWDLPLLLQFGLSTNAFKTDIYRWTIAVDALHPSNNYESVNTGTEFAYREFIFLRGGWHSLFLKEAEGGLSLGIGLKTDMLFSESFIKFDYAYRDMGRLDNVQYFSIGVEF